MDTKVSLRRPAMLEPVVAARLISMRGTAALPSQAGAIAVVVGSIVLLGWLIGSEPAKSLLPDADAVKVNAAIALTLLGAGVWQLGRPKEGRRVGTLLVLAASLLGAATSIEYLTGLNLGIDQALFADAAAKVGEPGRMSPFTAIGLVLLGVSAVAARWTRARALVIASVALTVSLAALNIFSLIFGGQPPPFLAGYTQMSPAVAAVMLGLGVGVIALLGDSGPLSVLTGGSAGSALSRRLLLAAIVLPFGLAWLRVRGEELGLYDSRFGASLMLVATILGLTAVVLTEASAGRRLEHERQAAQSERDRFFDLSLDMLATATPDGTFIRLNPAWQTTLGYSTEELTAKPFLEFVHPDDRDATVYETQRQFAEGKTVLQFQNRYRHRDGSYRWLEWTSQPAMDGSVVYAIARDISVRKREEERATKRAASLTVRNERLADRSTRDPLTGLHNRAYLDASTARLESRQRRPDRAAPLAAIMFDLDHFGQFNKQHGHQAGDAVLRRFAELLRQRFRGGDVVARFGGEEFVVLLDNATRDDAVRAAEQIRSRLADTPISFDGSELRATVSAGCAELHGSISVSELLTAADVALSQAKRAGRNMVVAA